VAVQRRPQRAVTPTLTETEEPSQLSLRRWWTNDRNRVSLDRHATYVVAAYLAGAAR
jgi:hypothetical protein